jgi:hypothetical protein
MMQRPYALERLERCPSSYTPSSFFMEYIRSFLPPIYMEEALNLSQRLGLNFVQVWAWESGNLMAESGLREELGQVERYLGRRHEPRPTGTSVRLSEVYRSAFLRTLAWFRELGKLEDTIFLEQSAHACPVDLSLWQVHPGSPPTWWPRFQKPRSNASSDMNIIGLGDWEALRALNKTELERVDNRRFELMAAEGPCLWAEAPSGTSVHFSFTGFGYRKTGPTTPDAGRVYNCLEQRAIWLEYPQDESVLAALDSENTKYFMPGETGWRVEGFEILPLVAKFRPLVTNLWQWYRGIRAMWLPSYLFCEGPWRFECDSKSCGLWRDRHKVAISQDWRLGALEEYDENSFSDHGQFVAIDSNELQQKLQQAGLRLGYLLSVEIKTQKYSYEKAEKVDHKELLEVGRIIT